MALQVTGVQFVAQGWQEYANALNATIKATEGIAAATGLTARQINAQLSILKNATSASVQQARALAISSKESLEQARASTIAQQALLTEAQNSKVVSQATLEHARRKREVVSADLEAAKAKRIVVQADLEGAKSRRLVTQADLEGAKAKRIAIQSDREQINAANALVLAKQKTKQAIIGVVDNLTRHNKVISESHAGILRFTGGLKNLILTMTGFILLRNAIRSVLNAFGDLFRAMITGASNTQLLQIRFLNLTATSLQLAKGIENYGTALKMAEQPAADLLEWVNQLAVKTIFSRDDVARVVSLAMAFDMTSGQAQTLTQAMVDWASGMGLGEDALQRMIVNFGQMMRMGKITQRELRDLAIGGLFPVNEALARIGERAGLTGDALKEFMSDTATSGVPVNALLQEFVTIAGERFPDAGRKMAKTWAGVTQNIKDFVTTILGASLLGPTMSKIVNSLSDTLDKALSPAVRATATVIGERLAASLEKVVYNLRIFLKVIGDLAKSFGIVFPSILQIVAGFEVLADIVSSALRGASVAIRDWIDDSGASLGQAANDFFNWGFNLISQFAQGILEGISTVLSTAMNFLASVLEYFLGPGSPPRVAPNIDVWGESAINEFLKGMTKADFSVLDALQGPLKSTLDTMANLGLIAKDSVGSIFVSVSEQIIAAIDELERTGQVGEAVFIAIRNAGGELGDELEELARRQFALLAAMKEVEDAQRALTEAQQADEDAKKRVQELTKEYRDLVKAGASKDVLKAKREEIKLAMDAREETRDGVTAAEDRVKAAEDALEPLKEAAQLQETLIKQLIELAQAQADLAKAGAGGAGGAGGVFAGLGDALKDFQSDMWATGIKMEMMKRSLELRLSEIKDNFKTTLKDIFKPFQESYETYVKPSFDRINESLLNLKSAIPEGVLEKLTGKIDVDKLVKFAGAVVGTSLAFKGLMGPIKFLIAATGIGGLISKIGSVIGWLLKLLLPTGKVGLAFAILGIITAGLKIAWDRDFLGMQTTITNWYNTIKPLLDRFIADMKEKFSKDNIQQTLGDLGQAFVDWINGVDWNHIGELLISSFINAYAQLNLRISEWVDKQDWKSIGEKIGKFLATFAIEGFKFIINLPGNLWAFLKELPGKIATFFSTTDWKSVAEAIWNALVAQLKLRWELFKAGWEFVLGLLLGFFGEFNFADWAIAILTGIATELEKAWNILSNAFKNIFDMLKTLIETSADIIGQLIGIAWAILEHIGNEIAKAGSWLIGKIKEAIGSINIKDIITGGLGLSSGGYVTEPGVYALAEEGPELVLNNRNTRTFLKAIQAMDSMARHPVSARPVFSNSQSSVSTRNYNLSVNTLKSSGNVVRDFAIMEALAG